MQNLILLSLCFCLVFSCKVPESEYRESEETTNYREPSPGSGGSGASEGSLIFGREVRWKSYQLPVERANGSMGGIDFAEDSAGFLHAALTIKYLDVSAGGYRYVLYYYHNKFGYWTRSTLRYSNDRFYKVSGGYDDNNFVRVLLDENEDPMIFMVNREDELELYYNGSVRRLAVDVGSFAVNYDEVNRYLHVAHMDDCYNAYRIYYTAYNADFNQIINQSWSGFGASAYQNHIELVLHRTQAVILFKAWSGTAQTGRFYMIYQGLMSVLSNGVYTGGVFNAYFHNGVLKTCMRNVVYERMELNINVDIHSGSYRTASYSRNNTSPYHCLVTEDHHYPMIRYNNYGGWNSYLEYYNWSYHSEGRTNRFPITEIMNLKWYRGRIWMAGYGSDNPVPTILVKE